MGTRTISVTDEAYATRSRMKGRGESFNDVILKLVGRGASLGDCFGTWEMDDEERSRIEGELGRAWRELGGRPR
jgi:predicted CopG family antitoxin